MLPPRCFGGQDLTLLLPEVTNKNMSSLRGVEVLQRELQRAQAKLKDVDENIKKMTGFDPLEKG